MNKILKQSKKKLPWWIYKYTLLKLQHPHSQNDFLKIFTAKH